jgi:hypothetical protein
MLLEANSDNFVGSWLRLDCTIDRRSIIGIKPKRNSDWTCSVELPGQRGQRKALYSKERKDIHC